MSLFPAFSHGILALVLLLAPVAGAVQPWIQSLVHLLLALLLGSFAALELAGRAQGERVRRAPWEWLPLGLFAAQAAAAPLWTRFPHSVDRGALNSLVGVALFLVLSRSAARWRRLYILALGGGAALAAAGAAPDLLLSWTDSTRDARGFLGNSNVLAGVLLLTLPFLVLTAGDVRAARWIVGAGSALGVLCLLGTRSRIAWVVGAVEAVFLSGLFSRRPRTVWVVAAAALGAAVWAWAGSGFPDADRLSWWKAALVMWRDAPVFGLGPGAYGEAYPGFRIETWGQNSLFAHNFFLEMLAERGLIGAGAFVALIYSWGIAAFRAGRLSTAAKAALAGTGGFLVYQSAHVGFSLPGPAWMFWAAAGLLRGEMDEDRVPSVAPAGGKARLWVALSVSILFGMFSLRLYRAQELLDRAGALIMDGKTAEARSSVDAGLAWNPREAGLHSLRAAMNAADGEWDAAAAAAAEALELAPFSARLHAEAGAIAARRARLDEALDHFRSAVRLMPLSPGHWLALGGSCEASGLSDEAARAYGTVLSLLEDPRVLGGTPEDRGAAERSARARLEALGSHAR